MPFNLSSIKSKVNMITARAQRINSVKKMNISRNKFKVKIMS